MGRMPLHQGREGFAPVLETVAADQEQVALISVSATAVGDAARQRRYLQRRASLLGCDGITHIRPSGRELTGVCVRNRTSRPPSGPDTLVRSPSHALVSRVANDAVHGSPLLKVLHRIAALPANQRAWPLEWYLANYPHSPYITEVENLFVASEDFGQAASETTLRAGPRSR